MRNRPPLAAPLLLAAALLLTGCVQSIVEDAVNDAVSNAAEDLAEGGSQDGTDEAKAGSGGDGGESFEGSMIPAHWPDAVPLPDGEPTSSLVAAGAMMLHYTLADATTARAHAATIEGAGFATAASSESPSSSSYSFTSDVYTVNYSFSNSSDGVTQLTQVAVQLTDRQSGPGDLVASIPLNWPSSVPTPPGDVAMSNTFESIGIGVNIENLSSADADGYLSQLARAGLETVSESSYQGGSQVALTNGTYDVTFISADAGDGTLTVQVALTVAG